MKKLHILSLTLVLCVLLIAPRAGVAHPHVWIDYSVTAVFNDKGLAGFELQWAFDEMFSEQIREVVSLRGDSPTQEQIDRIKTELFDNLRHYNYFSEVWIDGNLFKVQFVRDFNVRFHQGKAIYEFFVPCTVLATAAPKTVRFMARDPEIFVDFSWANDSPAQIVNPPNLNVVLEMVEDRSSSFFGGLFTPKILHIQFRQS